jgi:oligoendopeptidase F
MPNRPGAPPMLAGKVEDMLNTVVRQTAFYQFETLLHDERRSGELLPERIGEIWLQVQTESLGPAFEFTPDYTVFWAYMPHFIHSPFYVYAYAFGDCLVNALYAEFQAGHPASRRNTGPCCAPAAPSGTRICWPRSGWMRPTPRSGSAAWT